MMQGTDDLFACALNDAQAICGADEAGRGPLAGAVYAAAVILGEPIEGLNDSKKLSAKTRERLSAEIKAKARAWCIPTASVEEIDEINILQTSLLAMTRAVQGLSWCPSSASAEPGPFVSARVRCPTSMAWLRTECIQRQPIWRLCMRMVCAQRTAALMRLCARSWNPHQGSLRLRAQRAP